MSTEREVWEVLFQGWDRLIEAILVWGFVGWLLLLFLVFVVTVIWATAGVEEKDDEV